MNVSRETDERFTQYEKLLRHWNKKINLVSEKSLVEFSDRHLVDCLQLVNAVDHVSGHWVDLGSGGGFPGVVVAISTVDQDISVTLVESDQRKSAFLRTVVRELGLSHVTVRTDRIESLRPQDADHVSARALAPLPKLLGMVQRHLKPTGDAWLMKGRAWKDECRQAEVNWRFDVRAIQSTTDPESAILRITGVTHA